MTFFDIVVDRTTTYVVVQKSSSHSLVYCLTTIRNGDRRTNTEKKRCYRSGCSKSRSSWRLAEENGEVPERSSSFLSAQNSPYLIITLFRVSGVQFRVRASVSVRRRSVCRRYAAETQREQPGGVVGGRGRSSHKENSPFCRFEVYYVAVPLPVEGWFRMAARRSALQQSRLPGSDPRVLRLGAELIPQHCNRQSQSR